MISFSVPLLRTLGFSASSRQNIPLAELVVKKVFLMRTFLFSLVSLAYRPRGVFHTRGHSMNFHGSLRSFLSPSLCASFFFFQVSSAPRQPLIIPFAIGFSNDPEDLR